MIAHSGFLATPVAEHLPELVREAFLREEARAADGAQADADSDADSDAAPRFGPYRVTREIGRGGMGTVYEAERADRRYDRRVAIKTISPAGAGRLLGGRFESERRILAGLEHENIARLYDAGATPGGVPFFVMELVDGRRIDDWCDQEAASLEARLDLFDRVCEALEYAHGRLVAHGDIKPGNILVTAGGVPKLLDFGVARLTTDAVPTAGPMTPEYASPERLRGEPAATADDVYALGVLLYVLLAGRHPYRPSSRVPAEVERAIRAAPIPPPSRVVEPGGPVPRRRVEGDLDAIVRTAMDPDPAGRYASVGHLRRDLHDHRAGLPVSARPATAAYRAGKFVRRHRLGLAATALVILSLAGGLAGTAWQARVAERHAVRAERTRDYLVSLFETFDPDEAGIGPVTAEEMLDRGAERLDADLAGQPAVRAELGGVLGRLYQRMGLYDKARPLLTTARAGLVDAYGERHPETAAATARLAYLLYDEGEYEEAEEMARTALDARRELFGRRDTAVANSLTDLGAIRRARGEWDEAETLYREALAIDRESGTPEQVATDLDNLGVLAISRGEHEEARKLLAEALDMRRELYGDRHTKIAYSLLNLAEAESAAGRYEEAERLLRETIALRRDLLGDTHPHTALALNNLGNTLQRAGDLDGAEAAHLEALEIRRQVFGGAHPDVAISLNNLGVVAYFRGDYSGAADRFAEVIPIWREQLGDEHPNVLTALNNLGASRREAGEYEAAELVLRQVLSLRRGILDENHPDIGQSLNNLAIVLHRRGALEEAERTYRDAVDSWRVSLGDEHPTLAMALVGLGRLLTETGRAAEAEAPLREAVALREAGLEPESSPLASARAYLGFCLATLGAAEESAALFDAALPVLEAAWGPDDELVMRVRAARRT